MSAVLSACAPVSSVSSSAASAIASTLPALSSLLSTNTTNTDRLPVLHRTAQPISVDEFYDALRAAAPPRFPNARCAFSRRVGLAISGGVDSMALAYLCSQLRPRYSRGRQAYLADARIEYFSAFIVNHNLREGSAQEAEAVFKQLNKLKVRAFILNMKWPTAETGGRKERKSQGPGPGPEPTALETNARRLRYRLLAQTLVQQRIVSLLLAHHEDDQYETILMRLISGYGLHGGIRGLRGMRPANDLPECYGIYGAHRSGFWADQNENDPYILLNLSRRERRNLKDELMSGIDWNIWADEMRAGGGGAWDRLRAWEAYVTEKNAAPLSPMDTEDLGVIAYRPLLNFAKDRLVATCMANGVQWFEDHTNADQTLTMRNALRHMVRTHALPEALQKPAVLRLAARCDATVLQQEAEARQLVIKQGMIRDFSPNVGTLVVRLLPLNVHAHVRRRKWQTRATAYHNAAALEKRRLHLRTIAALSVRILLSYVTPEDNLTPVSQLHKVVDTLFPELADPKLDTKATPTEPPKNFTVCSVQFAPLASKTTAGAGSAWLLSRAPYLTPTLERVLAASASVPTHTGSLVSMPRHPSSLPFAPFPAVAAPVRWAVPVAQWPWSQWGHWVLFDGRFWIRLRSRLPVVVSLQPFALEHSKPFRESLAGDLKTMQLARFHAMLKAHAPGKVRYTLPGIYVSSDIGWALRGEPYWPDHLVVPKHVADNRDLSVEEHDQRAALTDWERSVHDAERAQWAAPDRPTQQLLALPTIGVHVPGVDKWVEWEVRYRKVDTGLLEAIQREAWKGSYWGQLWHPGQ